MKKTILFGGSGIFGPIILKKYPKIISVGRSKPPKNVKNKHIQISSLSDLKKLNKIKSKAVVMASGGWINKHIVEDLPVEHKKAYDQFNHAPMLVANVALTNWRFLEKLGITAYQWKGGFGFHTNIRKPMHVGKYQPDLDPNKPITLTFYVSFEKTNLI